MNRLTTSGVRLSLSNHSNPQGLKYQLLTVELTRKDRIIYPEELADVELPPGIDTRNGVVISGRGRCGYMIISFMNCTPLLGLVVMNRDIILLLWSPPTPV